MSKLSIKVIPKSGRSEMKFDGKTLKVWLKAAPAEGKANDELVRMLADKLRISRSEIEILRGFSSKNKIVDILGLTLEEIKKTVV